MKAPSVLCLQTLRHIALSRSGPLYAAIPQRCYASIPDKPPPPRPHRPAPPKPAIARPPPQTGSELRKKSEDDADLIPQPLARPIGMPDPPRRGENTGLDKRTRQQRHADFVDYDKHLAKRVKMARQFSKPYFRDWSNMRFHKGKVFVANDRLFRAAHALFFPNFFGRPLRRGLEKRDRKDGYGGLGRDTCDVMGGRVSVVSFVSNAWAMDQVETFCGAKQNPGLQDTLKQSRDVAQRVEINYEDNVLKWWILRFFGLGRLRRERSEEQQERYFIVRRGISEDIKEAIGLVNLRAGYVYLVDEECKIRWAGSAVAEEKEKESMIRGLAKLVQEARGAKVDKDEKTRLEETVGEVIGVEEKKRAAAGG